MTDSRQRLRASEPAGDARNGYPSHQAWLSPNGGQCRVAAMRSAPSGPALAPMKIEPWV
jgi:hypothetical protein